VLDDPKLDADSSSDWLRVNTERWGAFYGDGCGNVFPDENLVRLVRGSYGDFPRAGRAIDIGFGSGANLVFLARSGFEAHGLEVSRQSIGMAEALATEAGVRLELGLIEDTGLPFPDDHFDLVLSWSAIYYHGNRTLVSRAIDEFHRVCKPGGVLLMSVTHPNSSLAERLSGDVGDGAHRIESESPHDNREGLEIFYDADPTGWHALLEGFGRVEEGYVEIDLFTAGRRDAWRLFRATKQAAEHEIRDP
jgi:SAM-dependent methyltransferase